MGRKSIIEAERDSINTSGPKPKQSQFRLLEAKYFPKTTGSYNETPYVKSKHLLNKWAEVRGRFRHSVDGAVVSSSVVLIVNFIFKETF